MPFFHARLSPKFKFDSGRLVAPSARSRVDAKWESGPSPHIAETVQGAEMICREILRTLGAFLSEVSDGEIEQKKDEAETSGLHTQPCVDRWTR
jgi:hypothetical protein